MSEELVANALATEQGGAVNEQEAEVVETAEGGGDEGTQPNGDEKPEQHKRLGGWQRKIRRLENEVEVWRNEALKTRTDAPKTETPEAKPKTEEDPRPKLENFEDADEYYVALGKWGARQELKDAEAKKAAKAEKDKQQEAQKTFKQRVDDQHAKGIKAHEDFDELVAENPNLQITPVMAEAIVDSEIGEEIAYELGKNPAEAARIAKLSPASQAREIGKIEARLVKQEPKAEATEEEPPKPPVSRAPAPIKPVQKSTGTTKVDLDDPKVPYKDWVKARDAQLAKNKKG